jgi:hypothetical protein
LDAKAAIVDALTKLQASTVQGGEVWLGYEGLKKAAEAEADPAKLIGMAKVLQEELAKGSAEGTSLFSDNHPLVKQVPPDFAYEAPAAAERVNTPRRRRRP